ncbi:MAG: hypothetical protein A2639_01955 [Candidatus Staskawiczbacteria bacterium RIFCSPHIGHO2_01_FULL_34_27]|uniref:Uncharacterized protein n=1 Tax=Candidatus Staskawiczbacteria bacterium RIFCSPHIGHO2_01_FULL_34_27 TaxID=1802199 RepID=A0A1G2HK42_9BACT|nr:MAG: hypothetical protein A2639_01955 [Candidatus Staskawiczbacteria bacterium RIFCSPHIGHO2_01_FULL_34_27]
MSLEYQLKEIIRKDEKEIKKFRTVVRAIQEKSIFTRKNEVKNVGSIKLFRRELALTNYTEIEFYDLPDLPEGLPETTWDKWLRRITSIDKRPDISNMHYEPFGYQIFLLDQEIDQVYKRASPRTKYEEKPFMRIRPRQLVWMRSEH